MFAIVETSASVILLNRGNDTVDDFMLTRTGALNLVEGDLVQLVVRVFTKCRRNHHCESKFWIHRYNMRLSESISAFG